MTSRVLVVEDHPDSRELLKDFLEHHGYQVTTATNGAEALSLLETEPFPDVIVLDLTMPMMSGWTLRETLLDDERRKHIPVIVVSALEGVDPLSVHASLQKPVDLKVLLETIRGLPGAA